MPCARLSRRTNTPTAIAGFPDQPFDDDLPSYVGHKCVLEYLQEFATQHQLDDYITYNTTVKKITPVIIKKEGKLPVDDDVQWEVSYRNVLSGLEDKSLFDGVIICTG